MTCTATPICDIPGCTRVAKTMAGLCRQHHVGRTRNGEVDLLVALLRGTPKLPGALCVGRSEWDGNTTDEVVYAIRECRRCPALARCRQWIDSLPPSRRPNGGQVAAGRRYRRKSRDE